MNVREHTQNGARILARLATSWLVSVSLIVLVAGCVDSDLRNPGPAAPGPFTPAPHTDGDTRQIGFFDLANRQASVDFFDSLILTIQHDETDTNPDTIAISFLLCPIQASGTVTNVNNFTATGTFFTQPITIVGTITPFRATLTVDGTICKWDQKEQTLGLLPCDTVIQNEPQLITICP